MDQHLPPVRFLFGEKNVIKHGPKVVAMQNDRIVNQPFIKFVEPCRPLFFVVALCLSAKPLRKVPGVFHQPPRPHHVDHEVTEFKCVVNWFKDVIFARRPILSFYNRTEKFRQYRVEHHSDNLCKTCARQHHPVILESGDPVVFRLISLQVTVD